MRAARTKITESCVQMVKHGPTHAEPVEKEAGVKPTGPSVTSVALSVSRLKIIFTTSRMNHIKVWFITAGCESDRWFLKCESMWFDTSTHGLFILHDFTTSFPGYFYGLFRLINLFFMVYLHSLKSMCHRTIQGP